ncbi:hypothetical protein ACIBL3_38590 [Kribbella sp. NPDC050124]|uniref:hypothetical protein n=1 Tax=Kribbella sp. NPDC050124 TaxID=3364114 RepID=UPI0037A66841
MIDLSESVAMKTVTFDRPITGKELIDAVRATCESGAGRADDYGSRYGGGDGFYEDKKYDDGYLHVVGRSSSTPYQNLLVTPTKESAYINPEETYASAVVVRHDHTARGSQTLGRFGVDDEINSVIEFSERLAHTVEHGRHLGGELSRDPRGPAVDGRADQPVRAEDAAKTWGPRSAGRSQGTGRSF